MVGICILLTSFFYLILLTIVYFSKKRFLSTLIRFCNIYIQEEELFRTSNILKVIRSLTCSTIML